MSTLSPMKIFECMNTTIQFGGLQVKEDMNEKIVLYFSTFEQRFSRFIESSEITTLNNMPIDRPIFVSEELYSILKEAIYFAEKTEYLFNPLIGSRLNDFGYDTSFQPYMYKEVRDLMPFSVHKTGIELLPQMNTIIKHVNDRIDINGIAKGWSVDQARLLAVNEGVTDGFINAGGDATFWGTNTQEVGVSNPLQPELDIISLFVKYTNMATSSPLYRKWKQGNQERNHLINGQTGNCANTNVIQVTAFAPSVREAEVISKTLCMMPFESGISWLCEHFPGCAAIIIREDGKIAISNSVHLYVEGMNLL